MPNRRLVLGAYFLSGACGLVYEVVWTRYLSLTFGVTVFATSTVLAAYMAGLALGSLLVGRRVDASPNPVRIYALLEIGVGLYALAVAGLFRALAPVYVLLANALEGHFLLFNLARAGLAFGVLLVPTTLMGGTVPALARALVVETGAVGWSVGLLYALNTFGAVAGCLGAGFVLLERFGMSETVAIAAAVNVAIGTVLLLAPSGSTPAAPGTAMPAAPVARHVRLATLVFAASGFCALAYEVVWTRVLVIHLFNSTYAFSMMLAVFLLGLAAGDLVLMRSYDRVARPLRWLGTVEVLIGLSVVVAALVYIPLGHVGGSSRGSWSASVVVMFLRAGIVLAPSAFLFGTTFPLVARVVCPDGRAAGRALGGVYAANTLGGVLGSLAAGFVLVPALGQRGTLVALAAANVVVGGVCWLAGSAGRERRRLVLATLALAALPAVVVPRTIFFDALETKEFRLVYYTEGVTDTSGVWESRTDGSRIVTYGDMRGTAGTGTDVLNRTQAHLAHLLHPSPRRSLQICFGVGNTLAAAALHPEVDRLDCVELSPHVRETASYFWTNHEVLQSPKVHLIIDDGRNFLLRTRERYDVITLEPPDIFTAGVVNLYTEEFYRLAADALADGGVFCQWLPIGEMTEVEMRMLVGAFQAVFPETTMWKEGRAPAAPLLLVGTKHPLRIDVEALAGRMRRDEVRDDLAHITMGSPAQLLDLFIAGPEATRRWVGEVSPVVDDRTVVDFTTPTSVYSGYGFGYFRVQGRAAEESRAHMEEVVKLYARLRESPAPLLVNDGR